MCYLNHKTHSHTFKEKEWRENTRANTAFDRFCTVVNSHLTFDSFHSISSGILMIVASTAIISFYNIYVIDNKNWFPWFQPIFHHLIRGLLHSWLKCGDWKDRHIQSDGFCFVHRNGKQKTLLKRWFSTAFHLLWFAHAPTRQLQQDSVESTESKSLTMNYKCIRENCVYFYQFISIFWVNREKNNTFLQHSTGIK